MAPTLDSSYMAAVWKLVEVRFSCTLCAGSIATLSVGLDEAGKHIFAQALWESQV